MICYVLTQTIHEMISIHACMNVCTYVCMYIHTHILVYLLHVYTCITVGECIAGWDVAVSTMRKGELSRFLVSPAYAYGELGCPPRIPPNSTSKHGYIYLHVFVYACMYLHLFCIFRRI